MNLSILLWLALSFAAQSIPAPLEEEPTGLSVHFRVRTTSDAQDFPAIYTDKQWSSGEIEDYTSHHELGLSRSSGTDRGWAIALAPNGSWTWNLGDGKRRLDYRPTFERQPLSDGEWHHIGFAIDDRAGEARLYHDGREVAVYSTAGIGEYLIDQMVKIGQAAPRNMAMLHSAECFEVEDLVAVKEPLEREEYIGAWEAMGGVVEPEGMADEPVKELSILAWNIWHGGRRDGNVEGIERVVAAIRESGADAVAMQETYGSGAEIADRLGWYFYLRSSNLSVMSRYPIRETFDLYESFRFGGVTLELSPGQLVRLFSLWINYLPDYGKAIRSGEASPAQLVAAEMETRGSEIGDVLKSLAPVLAESEAIPVIVAGDFNSPSHLDWIDAVKERHGGLVVPWPVSTQMAAVGFTDSFRSANPDVANDRGRTWSPRFTDAWQDRIDYVYYRGSALEVIESRMIDHVEPSWPSDHAAVVSTLRVKPQVISTKGVSVDRDDEAGTLRFALDGREAFVYQYGKGFAIPHLWPLRSPSGKSLLVQKTEPYPHHRSLWIVDRVQLGDGPDTDFYHEWKNLRDAEKPELGHHSFIRHDSLTEVQSEVQDGRARAAATAELTWLIRDEPVLAQTWSFELESLGDGEYLLDLAWELRAEYGDVKFQSDWVHYAWPYLRMDPLFNGEHGGVLVDDQGRRGQAETNEKYARWIDYSGTVEGVTEGVAVFLPDDGEKRKWLTREYGTFGPRRPDAWSGTKFTLKRGEKLEGRVGILVHRGDAEGGRVAERYRERFGASD